MDSERLMSETTLLPMSIEPQELVYQCRNQILYRIVARFDGFSKENYTYIFYSDEFREAIDSSDQRVWISLPRCIEMVCAQQIVDSLSIIALLAYHTLLHKR